MTSPYDPPTQPNALQALSTQRDQSFMQAAPPWSPEQPGNGQLAPAPQARRQWIWLAIVAAVVGCLAVLLFVAPGWLRTHDISQQVEAEVTRQLVLPMPQGYGATDISNVQCEMAGDDDNYRCEVTGSTGSTIPVAVGVIDSEYKISIDLADLARLSTGKVFDKLKLEAGVTKILTAAKPTGFGLEVTDVACPGGQPVTAGTSFNCTLLLKGVLRSVLVTVTDEDGTYQVGIPN